MANEWYADPEVWEEVERQFQEAGLGSAEQWAQQYRQEHGVWPGERSHEPLQEAVYNAMWGKTFQETQGRAPSQAEWERHYYQPTYVQEIPDEQLWQQAGPIAELWRTATRPRRQEYQPQFTPTPVEPPLSAEEQAEFQQEVARNVPVDVHRRATARGMYYTPWLQEEEEAAPWLDKEDEAERRQPSVWEGFPGWEDVVGPLEPVEPAERWEPEPVSEVSEDVAAPWEVERTKPDYADAAVTWREAENLAQRVGADREETPFIWDAVNTLIGGNAGLEAFMPERTTDTLEQLERNLKDAAKSALNYFDTRGISGVAQDAKQKLERLARDGLRAGIETLDWWDRERAYSMFITGYANQTPDEFLASAESYVRRMSGEPEPPPGADSRSFLERVAEFGEGILAGSPLALIPMVLGAEGWSAEEIAAKQQRAAEQHLEMGEDVVEAVRGVGEALPPGWQPKDLLPQIYSSADIEQMKAAQRRWSPDEKQSLAWAIKYAMGEDGLTQWAYLQHRALKERYSAVEGMPGMEEEFSQQEELLAEKVRAQRDMLWEMTFGYLTDPSDILLGPVFDRIKDWRLLRKNKRWLDVADKPAADILQDDILTPMIDARQSARRITPKGLYNNLATRTVEAQKEALLEPSLVVVNNLSTIPPDTLKQGIRNLTFGRAARTGAEAGESVTAIAPLVTHGDHVRRLLALFSDTNLERYGYTLDEFIDAVAEEFSIPMLRSTNGKAGCALINQWQTFIREQFAKQTITAKQAFQRTVANSLHAQFRVLQEEMSQTSGLSNVLERTFRAMNLFVDDQIAPDLVETPLEQILGPVVRVKSKTVDRLANALYISTNPAAVVRNMASDVNTAVAQGALDFKFLNSPSARKSFLERFGRMARVGRTENFEFGRNTWGLGKIYNKWEPAVRDAVYATVVKATHERQWARNVPAMVDHFAERIPLFKQILQDTGRRGAIIKRLQNCYNRSELEAVLRDIRADVAAARNIDAGGYFAHLGTIAPDTDALREFFKSIGATDVEPQAVLAGVLHSQ